MSWPLVVVFAVGTIAGRHASLIATRVTPGAKVRENGAAIEVSAWFKNRSAKPIVLLGIECRDGQGVQTKRDHFMGFVTGSDSRDLYRRYNLLGPGEEVDLSIENAGLQGRYPYEFRLEFLVASDDMLELPVFEMVKRLPVKRNPPTYAPVAEYEQWTEKSAAGKLRDHWNQHAPESHRYFLDVTPEMAAKAESEGISTVLDVAPDEEIARLRSLHPEVREYRSHVPHFGLAFFKGTALFVGSKGKYRKLGAVQLEAVAHIGRQLEARKPIRISLGPGTTCMREVFAQSIQPPGPIVSQAVEIGQKYPFVDLRGEDLDKLWTCMERDGAEMQLSWYGNYLVIAKFPSE